MKLPVILMILGCASIAYGANPPGEVEAELFREKQEAIVHHHERTHDTTTVPHHKNVTKPYHRYAAPSNDMYHNPSILK